MIDKGKLMQKPAKQLLYNLTEIGYNHLNTDDLLNYCRMLNAMLLYIEPITTIPVYISSKYKVLSAFNNVVELFDWLTLIINQIEKDPIINDFNLFLEPSATSIALEAFNTKPTTYEIIDEGVCLKTLSALLNKLTLITRGELETYYTRILNPSMEHIYQYLYVYIRIIENEELPYARNTRRPRQKDIRGDEPLSSPNEENTI